MDLKASRKRQLAAAVTLAVMGMAWVSVPQQVWAKTGDAGAIDKPLTLAEYELKNATGGAIDTLRKDFSGDDVLVAQYHSGWADNPASGDMSGKTITIGSMSIEGVIAKDGIGQVGDLSQGAVKGSNGGLGYAAGLFNRNGLANATINVGSAVISATGGGTATQYNDPANKTYQREGGEGQYTTGNANGVGGAGAEGGNGGKAIAVGVAIGVIPSTEKTTVSGAVSSNVNISGGDLTVKAEGALGGHGGYGGTGAQGADGAALEEHQAANGTKGADGTDAAPADKPAKPADGTDASSTPAGNGTVSATGYYQGPGNTNWVQTGWSSTAGANGSNGGDGTTGTTGKAGGNGVAGAVGTVGAQGNTGQAGGTGGAGANGGNGGDAVSTGFDVNNIAKGSISLNSLTVEAKAGVGNAGGTGGAGGNGGVGGIGQQGGNGGVGGDGGDGGVGGDGSNGGKGQQGGQGVSNGSGNGFNWNATVGGNGGAGGAAGNGGIGGAAGNGGNGGVGRVGGTGGNGGNGGNGGAGGNGGNGGVATANGLVGTDNTDLNIAIGTITVTAVGGDGAKAGIGGAGGAGGAGGIGGQGGNGGDGGAAGTAGAGGQGGVGGTGGAAGAAGENNSVPIANTATIGANGAHGISGTQGAIGTAGLNGAGGDAGKGGFGGNGGTAGAAGTNGTGSSAYATAVNLANTNGILQTTSITATATAGKGVGSFSIADAYVAAGGIANTDNAGKDGTAGKTNETGTGTGIVDDKVSQDGISNATSNGGAGGVGITPTGNVAQSANGATAEAMGLFTTGGTLNVVSGEGLAISALAQDAATTNTAKAVTATNSNNVYAVTGDFSVTATATGDVDLPTAAAGTNPAFDYKANVTDTKSEATAFTVNGGSMLVDVAGKLTIAATATKGENTNFAQGMALDNTTVRVHTTDAINITATAADSDWQGAQGIEGNKNDLEFISDAGGITVTADGGNGTAGSLKHEYSVWTYDSNVTFDAKDAGIVFNGDVEVVTNATADSTLTLKSNTEVKAGTDSAGSLKISGTTMNLTDNLRTLTVADKTTLKGSTVYFYDYNDQADKYNTADYRTITTNDLDASGTNELFMRTNANGAYGQSVGNDQIVSENAATGSGTYDITVFDQGMRNGYNNAAGAAGKGHLNDDVVLIQGAEADKNNGGNATYNIKEMQYDNGIWAYEYEGKAEVGADGNLNLTNITTKACEQSSAQTAAQDANKIAAGAAVTLFGADETLMERLGDVRNSADDNDGVWAKYVGGKIKVDGLKGDNDFKYNGFAAGYDHEIGNNWRIGLAGQYAKGDTTLTNGDGEIKTAAGALYGTWTGDKGHHVDIIAKVGKVDSETSAYGGTIAQKLDGDFGSTAMSFAVEYGYRQDLNDGWFVEPMVRASYVHLGGDDYTVTTHDNTMSVTNDAMNSIVLRGGFLLGKEFKQGSSVYLKAAVLHDFDGDINTSIKGDGRTASYSDSIGGTAIEYGIGVNHKFNKDSSMYFDVERISGGDVTKNWGVNVGFRYSF